MSVQTTIAMNGVQADGLIFDFSPGSYGNFPDVFPKVKSIIYSGASSTAVRIYFAETALAAEQNRYDVLNDSVRNAVRGCYPVWLNLAGPIPWHLRMERPVAVDSFVRIVWDLT